MKKIKAILFDMDNTLLDFMKMKEEGMKAAVSAMIDAGLDMEKEEGYKKLFIAYLKAGIESDTAFTVFLKKETGKVNPKILAAGINAYLKAKQIFLKLYPDVIQTLKGLKKKKLILGIVTDAPKIKAYQRLLAMKIEKYFDFVIGFEDTGKKKKTEIPLRSALEKLKLEPSEVMMVGDSMKRDIIPAKKLGINTVFAKYGSSEKVKKIKPDFEIRGISEILKIV